MLDNLMLDYRFRARGEIDAPVPVVYVDIDSQSIEELGNFPWPRAYFAEAGAALLNTGNAKAVGVDIVFSEKGVSDSYDRAKWVEANIALARYLSKNPPMVVAASYAAREYREVTGKREIRNFPILREGLPDLAKVSLPEVPEFNIGRKAMWSPNRIGLIDTLDGGTRWVPMFAPTSVKRYDHMALNLALLYWGVDPNAVRVTPG
ncbi:MAG: CHASE2 domain-containing protein, partial [Opitutae bacterium]|nr:CHASE2 domain-containing protein [Opitutae bacterium]